METGAPRSGARQWRARLSGYASGRFARDVGALSAAQLIVVATSVAQGILIARWLGPRSYGLSALVMAYPALVFSFFDAQSSAASIRYLSELKQGGQREGPLAMVRMSHSVDAAIGVASFIVVAISAQWAAAHVLHVPSTVVLLLVYSGAQALDFASNTSTAVLSVTDRLTVVARIQTMTTIVRSALVVTFVAAGMGVAGVVWGGAISLVLDGAVFAVVGHRRAHHIWGGSWLRQRLTPLDGRRREILTFIAYSDLSSLLALLAKQADLILLGWFRGPQEVGVYRLARSLSGVVGNAVAPLHSAVFPRMSALVGAQDWDATARAVRRYTAVIGIPLAAAGALTLPFVPMVIRHAAGTDYAGAVWPTRLLLLSGCLWVACFWVRPLYFSLGMMRAWTVVGAVSSALVVVGTLVVAPRFGAAGTAAVQLAVLGVGGQVGAITYLRRVSPSLVGAGERS